jgi:hypothetical protein
LESVRVWARGLFLLSVFASTVMLLVPKSVIRQAKFVSELLLLLCVIAPLAGILRSGTPNLPLRAEETFTDLSIGEFYEAETARRIRELAEECGVEIKAVSVNTKDGGFSLDKVDVTVMPGPGDDRLEAFREAIRIYMGISREKVEIAVFGP